MASLREYLQDTHLTQLFKGLGEDATYTPVGGSGTSIKVIPRQPDETLDAIGDTRAYTTTTTFEVLVSEVADPQIEDTILYNGVTYTVDQKPMRRDVHRLIWTIETRLPDAT